MIELFHFVRPLWLLAIPVLALLWWLVRRSDSAEVEVGDLISPHLRAALIVNHR